MPVQVDRIRGWWCDDEPDAPAVALSYVARLCRSRPVVLATPVIVVLIFAAIQMIQRSGPTGNHLTTGIVISLALAATLVARRRAPLGTLAVLVVIAFIQWTCNVRLLADIALLFGVYTVASVYRARTAWVAAIPVVIGSVLAVLRWSSPDDRVDTVIGLCGLIAVAICAGMVVRGRKRAVVAAEQRALARERERQQQAQIMRTLERQRIAREMHDVVAHGLSVMVTLIEGALAQLDRDRAASATALQHAATTGRDSLADMRSIVGVLRNVDESHGHLNEEHADSTAAHHPQPGVSDLPELLTQFRATGLDISYTENETDHRVDRALSMSLYRIVQEALTNTVKHARGARHISVALAYQSTSVSVDVVDDGRPATATGNDGYGLIGIGERVALHRGSLEVGPTDSGWRVHADLPYSQEQS